MQIQTDGVLPIIPEPQDTDCPASHIGLAVDVGTTTVAVSAWLLSTREHLATVAAKNLQMRFGYDVIRRISFATRPPLAGSMQVVETGDSALHYSIITQLEKMFSQVLPLAASRMPRGVLPVVSSIVITGNTTMLSFVCAVPVRGIAAAPFTPASLFDFTATWNEVRYCRACVHSGELDKPTAETLQVFNSSVINSEVPVYFPPCVAAFIGADSVCAMLAAGIPVPGSKNLLPGDQVPSEPVLLMDVGTNSEIVLYAPESETHSGRILCTSAAAGPAFEAANISCGMSSVDGAVEKISYEDDAFLCHVIGGGKAKGICGSGLVSAAALLYRLNVIDKSGIIRKYISQLGDGSSCIQLTPAVYISQQDIRNLQLAKSAVRTGLQYLLEKTQSKPLFCMAGGFGAHLDLHDAVTIGLIPPELEDNCVQLGNAALSGASALLFSQKLREKASLLAKKAYQINLAAVADFQQRFLSMIDF